MPGEKNDEVGIKLLVDMVQNYQAVIRLMEDQLVVFEGNRGAGTPALPGDLPCTSMMFFPAGSRQEWTRATFRGHPS